MKSLQGKIMLIRRAAEYTRWLMNSTRYKRVNKIE
jgi:hypothetical protein